MGLKRYRPTAMNALSSLLLLAGTAGASDSSAQRLAVVVPAHAGDLSRAVSSLDRWPQECSPVTQDNVDLVLYYAEGEEDSGPSTALDAITASAGRCFSNTRLIYANLNEEVSPRVRTAARETHAPWARKQTRTGELKGDWSAALVWAQFAPPGAQPRCALVTMIRDQKCCYLQRKTSDFFSVTTCSGKPHRLLLYMAHACACAQLVVVRFTTDSGRWFDTSGAALGISRGCPPRREKLEMIGGRQVIVR